MSENTKIEWCDHTFNPWEGCQHAGPGCDHCYAETRNARFGGGVAVNWGPGAPRRRTSPANWALPVKWNKKAGIMKSAWARGVELNGGDEAACIAAGFIKPQRPKVFCASLADVFDNAVDPKWRWDLFVLIESTPNLDWLILTKRIGNAKTMLDDVATRQWNDGIHYWDDEPWSNVWLGATICNQEEADRDIQKLIEVPAAKRFLSMEPLLGSVDIRKWLAPWTCADCGFHGSEDDCGPDGCDKCGEQDAFGAEDVCKSCGADDQAAKPSCPRCGSHRSFELDNGFKFDSERKLIDQVIVGGESGPGARPMHPNWPRSLRDQCQAADVPFLFKQWGEFAPNWLNDDAGQKIPGSEGIDRMGKKLAGRLLDGREWNGVPS